MKWSARTAGIALALVLVAPTAPAQQPDGTPAVTGVWVKTTLPGSTVSAAYLSIKSARPLRLVKAETPLAGIAELHNMTLKDNVMEMKAEDAFEVPAGQTIELKPGGMHIMLMKVKSPIKPGDKVPLTLTFEAADRKPLVMKVEAEARDKDPRANPH